MSLHPDPEELMAWRDGEVVGDRAAELAHHAETCAECRDKVAAFATLSTSMQSWTIEAAPSAMRRLSRVTQPRRMLVWAAAAAVFVGVLATVRVECSPAPACDLRTMHLAFLPSHAPEVAADQAKPGAAVQIPGFEDDWGLRRRLPVKPAPGAKVTVVMFLDWQCPACRMAETAYSVVFADFEKRMPGAVVVQLKDFPLNMRCNPNVPVEMHPAACEAAVAVRLSREHGTAPALINFLFANQETLTPASVRKTAAEIGKISDFDARYTTVLKDVARDVDEGRRLEVGGTPTCFINGVLARNDNGRTLFSPDEVRLAIEAELKHVKK